MGSSVQCGFIIERESCRPAADRAQGRSCRGDAAHGPRPSHLHAGPRRHRSVVIVSVAPVTSPRSARLCRRLPRGQPFVCLAVIKLCSSHAAALLTFHTPAGFKVSLCLVAARSSVSFQIASNTQLRHVMKSPFLVRLDDTEFQIQPPAPAPGVSLVTGMRARRMSVAEAPASATDLHAALGTLQVRSYATQMDMQQYQSRTGVSAPARGAAGHHPDHAGQDQRDPPAAGTAGRNAASRLIGTRSIDSVHCRC